MVKIKLYCCIKGTMLQYIMFKGRYYRTVWMILHFLGYVATCTLISFCNYVDMIFYENFSRCVTKIIPYKLFDIVHFIPTSYVCCSYHNNINYIYNKKCRFCPIYWHFCELNIYAYFCIIFIELCYRSSKQFQKLFYLVMDLTWWKGYLYFLLW